MKRKLSGAADGVDSAPKRQRVECESQTQQPSSEAKGSGAVGSAVPRLDRPTRAQFAEYESSNRPVVLTSTAFGEWKAMTEWVDAKNHSLLTQRLCGFEEGKEPPVHVLVSNSSNFKGQVQQQQQMTLGFREFLGGVGAVLSGASPVRHCYLCQCPIVSVNDSATPALLPHLAPDLEPMPDLVPADRLASVNLWLSVGDTQSNLHYDEFHNLLVVISGTKRVHLFPPSETANLYPEPCHAMSSNHSRVDTKADAKAILDKFPRFATAQRAMQTATLARGDVLFIPEGWWHQVDSFSERSGSTLAVNVWWKGPAALMQPHMHEFYLRRLMVGQIEAAKERLQRALYSDAAGSGSAAATTAASSSMAATMTDEQLCDALFSPRVGDKKKDDGDGAGEAKRSAPSDVGTSPSAASALPTTAATAGPTAAGPAVAASFDFDGAARLLQRLEARAFERALRHAAAARPAQLRLFVLQMPPLCASLFTAQMEAVEEHLSVAETERFYAAVYAGFENSGEAVGALLSKNAAFAGEAFLAAIRDVVGAQCALAGSLESGSDVIAIDVVVVPDENAKRRSTIANSKLAAMDTGVDESRRFRFDDTHVPHMTLSQAYVQRDDLKTILIALKEGLGKLKSSKLEFEVISMDPGPDFNGLHLPSYVVKASELVASLHELASAVTLKHRVAGDAKAFFALPGETGGIGSSSVAYVGDFEQKASHRAYFPHITLGAATLDAVAAVKADKALGEPFSFTGSIAVYQLGNFCTCRKLLAGVD